jgi:hypothetical protein
MASKPTAHSDMLVVYNLAHMVLPATTEWGLSGTHVCLCAALVAAVQLDKGLIKAGIYWRMFSPTMLPPHRNTLLVIASSLLAV